MSEKNHELDKKMSEANPGSDKKYRSGIPLWSSLSYSKRASIRRGGLYAAILATLSLFVFPLFWMFNSALRTESSLTTRSPDIFSTNITLDHFINVFTNTEFPVFLMNSVIVAIGVVFLTVVLATLGGYGLTRMEMKYKKTFARGILFGYMFPSILLSIPMFIFWRDLGIINTYIGLILAETALALPFSLWLMWKFFQTVPYSLEESAQMAGASRFQAFVDIALPMAKPGVIAIGVWAFAVSWNEYTMAKILMPDRDMYVLTIGLEVFNQRNNILWGELMAASFISIIPAFLFVYFLQKYLLRGFRSGGMG